MTHDEIYEFLSNTIQSLNHDFDAMTEKHGFIPHPCGDNGLNQLAWAMALFLSENMERVK